MFGMGLLHAGALGYRQIGRRPFDEPELIRPADLFVYRKNLRAVPATDAPLRAET